VNERERRRRSLLQLLAVIFIMSLLFDLFPSGGSRSATPSAQPGANPDKGPKQSATALKQIVDSISGAVRRGADMSAVYPANISSFFQGPPRGGRRPPARDDLPRLPADAAPGEWERQKKPTPVAGRKDPVACVWANSSPPSSRPL